jgi:hypothetical protein
MELRRLDRACGAPPVAQWAASWGISAVSLRWASLPSSSSAGADYFHGFWLLDPLVGGRCCLRPHPEGAHTLIAASSSWPLIHHPEPSPGPPAVPVAHLLCQHNASSRTSFLFSCSAGARSSPLSTLVPGDDPPLSLDGPRLIRVRPFRIPECRVAAHPVEERVGAGLERCPQPAGLDPCYPAGIRAILAKRYARSGPGGVPWSHHPLVRQGLDPSRAPSPVGCNLCPIRREPGARGADSRGLGG